MKLSTLTSKLKGFLVTKRLTKKGIVEYCNTFSTRFDIPVRVISEDTVPNVLAFYSPMTHEIVVQIDNNTMYQYKRGAKASGLSEIQYFTSLMYHELGHAKDPKIMEYAMLKDSFYRKYSSDGGQEYADGLADVVITMEKRAWQIGSKYAKDIQAYDTFNQLNMKLYDVFVDKLLNTIKGDGKAMAISLADYRTKKKLFDNDASKYDDAVMEQRTKRLHDKGPISWKETVVGVKRITEERMAELMAELDAFNKEEN